MSSRHRSRERALQLLYQWESSGETPEAVITTYFKSLSDSIGGKVVSQDDFAEQLFHGVTRRADGYVNAALEQLNDGLGNGADQLFLKSALDGFAAIAFAASLGWGVGASALAVLVVQGSLTVLGAVLGDVLPAAHIAALTATGGLMLVGVALRLLHVVAGIAWIGASFYFIRLDLGLAPPPEDAEMGETVAIGFSVEDEWEFYTKLERAAAKHLDALAKPCGRRVSTSAPVRCRVRTAAVPPSHRRPSATVRSGRPLDRQTLHAAPE